MKQTYITTPIYYVNAKPHFGHAYTTLAADIIARFYKQTTDANSVFFLTGTDEHGAKNAASAEKAGKDPKSFCDEMVLSFQEAWKKLNIQYDSFIRTTDQYHETLAQNFLSALKEKGALYEGDYSGLYCVGCESFLTERQLDQNGLCPDHKTMPERITEKNWFFRLTDYIDRVQKQIETNVLHIDPPKRRQEVLGLFKQGLEDFSVSRPQVHWGIPLPWDSSQTIYVWVEALLNYWTAPHYLGKKKEYVFWPPNIQLMAKDIIKFHCIYWPSILLAYYNGDVSQLPKRIFAHGFFTVNGEKMSKSLGNVIDPIDLVDEYGTDGARYLIVSQFPFGNDGDVDAEKFTEKYNADLANGIGNVVSRTTTLIQKKVTDFDAFWRTVKNETFDSRQFSAYMEKTHLYEALKYALRAFQRIDDLLAKEKPWELDDTQDKKKIIETLAKAAATISKGADLLEAFLPETAKKIHGRINPKEQKITIGEPLFPRKKWASQQSRSSIVC